MKLPSWIVQNLQNRFTRQYRAVSDVRLQVSNLTRQTVLATCLEVADKGEKRRKGLLGRKGLSPGAGMWILPCESVHTVGMQFSIDLVYLDRRHRIKKVRSNVPPWRISACLSANSVLELPSGTICDTQSRPGDMLEFSSALPAVENSKGLNAVLPIPAKADSPTGSSDSDAATEF
jgi:uncharacterized protein